MLLGMNKVDYYWRFPIKLPFSWNIIINCCLQPCWLPPWLPPWWVTSKGRFQVLDRSSNSFTIILSAFNTLELLTLGRNNLLLPFFKIGKEKIALTSWFKKWQKTFYPLFSKQSWKMWQTITQLNLECCIYSHLCHADLASLSCKVKLRVQSIKRVKRHNPILASFIRSSVRTWKIWIVQASPMVCWPMF